MPTLENPFNPHIPPSTQDALAALGVPTSTRKAESPPESPAIELSAEELAKVHAIESESSEKPWDRARLIKWAKTFDKDAVWVDEMFQIEGQTIVWTESELDLSGTQVSEIPPNLQVETLSLSGTEVSKIPPGLQVKELWLVRTQVSEIPPDLQVEGLYLSHTQVSEIPPGLQVKRLYLSHTKIVEIPPNLQVEVLDLSGTQVSEIPPGLQVKRLYLLGTSVTEIPEGTALECIYCAEEQTALIASASARNITTEASY